MSCWGPTSGSSRPAPTRDRCRLWLPRAASLLFQHELCRLLMDAGLHRAVCRRDDPRVGWHGGARTTRYGRRKRAMGFDPTTTGLGGKTSKFGTFLLCCRLRDQSLVFSMGCGHKMVVSRQAGGRPLVTCRLPLGRKNGCKISPWSPGHVGTLFNFQTAVLPRSRATAGARGARREPRTAGVPKDSLSLD